MAELLEPHVRETDAFTFRMERDPLLRSTIVSVALFDRTPDWEVLVERIDRATRLTPTFRQRLVAAPLGLVPPRWAIDPDFDLAWHLRRVAAPPPRDLEAVLAIARNMGMTAFDPARPLWEFTLVEGLAKGRAALVMKVHHALTDGIGGMELAARVIDLQREPADLGPMPPVPTARPLGGGVDNLGEAVTFGLGRWWSAVRAIAGAAPVAARRTLRDPIGSAVATVATAASLARFVRPVTSTLSPVMQTRRLRWHYDVLDVPVDELKRAGRAADGTLNDAFLGAVTGGLRRYHERHGATVEGLRVTMPISLRRPDDPAGGNRITLVRFEVPVGVSDPVARMRTIDGQCRHLRTEQALAYSDLVAGALNLLPVGVSGGMLKHVDFLASNVPGFPVPIYVGGARVEGFYPFGPPIGAAANVTLISYRGTCNIGVTTDAGAVPDPDVFLACLAEGFDEVLAVGAPPAAAPPAPPRRRRPVPV